MPDLLYHHADFDWGLNSHHVGEIDVYVRLSGKLHESNFVMKVFELRNDVCLYVGRWCCTEEC